MDEILSALESLDHKGSFYSSKKTQVKHLDLKFTKLGALSFPLTENRIKEIIQIANPAKFGWRDETILDESVRKVWEVPKSRFRIGKKAWEKGFTKLLEEIKNDLGMPKSSKLRADLHNMLVYEEGNFFKPHQDSEKVDNMVATMVLLLPTEHEGGELIVDHLGEKKTLKANLNKSKELHCFSFYADCFHEVKEITKGYRVSLTFNLVLENYQGELDTLYENDFDKRLHKSLKHYFIDQKSNKKDLYNTNHPPQLVYLLDHEYTQKGLNWDNLKNADRVRVDSILSAADKLNLKAHLALADFHETWDCDFDYDDYKYYRRSNNDEDDETTCVPTYIMDTDTTLSYWINRDGRQVNFSRFCVNRGDTCWTGSNKELKPYNSEYMPWSGNCGNTLDRWYHRAAIVLWHNNDDEAILFEMDKEQYVNKIFSLIDSEENRKKVCDMLAYSSKYWKNYAREHTNDQDIQSLLKLTIYLNSTTISKNILSAYAVKIINLQTIKLWCNLISEYGVEWFSEVLNLMIKNNESYQNNLIPHFSDVIKTILNSCINPKTATSYLFDYQMNRIIKQRRNILLSNNDFSARYIEIKELILVVLYAKNDNMHLILLDYIKTNKDIYDPLCFAELFDIYKEHLSDKEQCLFKCDELYSYVKLFLKNEKHMGLRHKDDWSINKKSCCDCSYCKELNVFLLSSIDQEKKWSLCSHYRDHISSEIQKLYIPLEVRTEQSGRPYKLILTKSSKLYEDAEKRYKAILAALNKLSQLNFE